MKKKEGRLDDDDVDLGVNLYIIRLPPEKSLYVPSFLSPSNTQTGLDARHIDTTMPSPARPSSGFLPGSHFGLKVLNSPAFI
jgi:hypothetical protein